MDKGRIVNTNFWRDTYIVELDPIEKLLFLYLLTNPSTTMAGIYEISYRQAAFDTGIDKDMVERIMQRFVVDGKMYYHKGWLVLYNFWRHQRLNPSIVTGIKNAVSLTPLWLQEAITFSDKNAKFSMMFMLDITGVEEQTADSLGTVTPQKKLIEANRIEAKGKEDKVSNNSTNVLLAEKPPKNKSNEDINFLFNYWHEQMGIPITSNRQRNRNACNNLFKRHTRQGVIQLIDGCKLALQDQYAPRISDFVGLQTKLNDLLIWGKKKGFKNNAKAVDLTI